MNKIAAAVLLAGLVGMVTGKVSTILYYGGDHHGGEATEHSEEHAKRGYTIEGAEAFEAGGAGAGGTAGAAQEMTSIIPLLHSADVAAGESFFTKKCTTCHSVDKGGANQTGPNLWGVVGRKKGSHEGFNYSKGMIEKGGDWSLEDIGHFLHKPKQFVPGTIMAFAGISKEQDLANLVAYLNTQSDSPLAIPEVPAATEVPEEAGNAANDGQAEKEDAQTAPDKAGDAPTNQTEDTPAKRIEETQDERKEGSEAAKEPAAKPEENKTDSTDDKTP